MNHSLPVEELNQLSASEIELRSGKIGKLFLRFAIPSVIGLLFLGIQSIIDGIILGNYVGANALAGVNLSLPCFSFMSATSIIIGVGCQTVVSIRLGKLDRQGANNALFSGLIFIVLFALIGGILFFIYASDLAQLLGANDVLQGYATDYIRSLAPFFPILSITFFCDYILKALGHPIYAMIVMSISVLANIILDLLFVVGWDMNVTGAGLATGISFLLGALLGLPLILKERSKVHLAKGRFSWRLIGRMFYNGSSEGVAELSSGITILLFNITMMRYLGEIGVAAFTALQYVQFICILIYLGISNGIIPIVGYNYGANNWKRIRQIVSLGAKTNLILGILIFSALTLFGEEITRLFFSSNETRVVEIAAHGTQIIAFSFLFNGLSILASSYFTALGDAKTSIIISLLRGLVLLAPGIWILPILFGIEGVWLSIPIAEILTLLVSIYLVRRSFLSGEQLIKS